MIVHVFACDYDGTIADGGRVLPATADALARVRESGRKTILVTGRMLHDLQLVCPDVDRMFDAIVAENGALLYLPARRETRTLGPPPEPALIEALRRHAVRFNVGHSIVASDAALSKSALAAIQEAGVERTLVFNKGSLMLLPGGVTKGTGLLAALEALDMSVHNTVGIGDGENDHAFLSMCEFAIAVADAVPALRDRADYVVPEPGARGTRRFIDEHVLGDLAHLASTVMRHRLRLGVDTDGTPVTVDVHGTGLLVVGPSASGKSTITGVLVERLLASRRSVVLFDPEGDHRGFSEVPTVVVLGGKTEHALPPADALEQLLRHGETSVVLDLSALSRAEKVDYATRALATVSTSQSVRGKPHWVVIDEAHHILPPEGSTAKETLGHDGHGLCLITLALEDLAQDARPLVNTVASPDPDAFRAALATLGAPSPKITARDGRLDRHEAVIGWLRPGPPRAVRFRVDEREVRHQRHVRKYAEGELPPDRSFYFRGPEYRLNLRAANLTRFCELADGVDDTTWAYHLRRGDYSRWMREMVKDAELADDVTAVERSKLGPRESRRAVADAIRRRYTT